MGVLKNGLRTVAQRTMRRMVTSSWSRTAMNWLYLRLGSSSRLRFHREFARVFRDAGADLHSPASWRVYFAGRTVLMPLTRENLWQEWDSAVSIVANDMEVKQTYEALLASPQPPDLFVDVGANYGTHSLLFLAAGVDTVTFEPNSTCHDYFAQACALNDFKPQLEKVALGRDPGRITLSYPPRDTWNGSTSLEAVARLPPGDLVTEDVELSTLDSYVERLRGSRRPLVKIDTEGNELSVLQGARQVLAKCKPTIIFESLVADENRPALYAYLISFGYAIGDLPFRKGEGAEGPRLSREQFLCSRATNFMAVAIS